MDSKKRNEICSKCKYGKDDLIGGYICSLDNKKRYFEGNCKDFKAKDIIPKENKVEEPVNWYCPSCGNINEANSKKCSRCDFSLIGENKEILNNQHLSIEIDTWKCPKCNSLNEMNFRGCLNCGYIPKENEKLKYNKNKINISSDENSSEFEAKKSLIKNSDSNSLLKKRIQNLVIDSIIIYFLYFIFTMVTVNLFEIYILSNSFFFQIIFYAAYYYIFESIFSKSPAKYITKTIVVTKDSKKPGKKQIFVRSMCRLIPLDFLSYFMNKDGTTWHDNISETKVIETK